MMRYWLFLDDERCPPSWWDKQTPKVVTCRNYSEFKAVLECYGCPERISFDHDLGVDFGSGMDCAQLFVNWILDDQSRLNQKFEFDVHSMNPVGAANIAGLLIPFLEQFQFKVT